MEDIKQKNLKNTGDTSFQIVKLTERINEINKHLAKNPKDHSSKRGLMLAVGKRKRLLTYLHAHDSKGYFAVISATGLRG